MSETTEQTEVQKRRAAYSAAEQRLREAHHDEFRALVKEEADKLGVTYVFRKTEAERAEETLNKLLTDHPELRDRVVGEQPTA
jgi:hypothetical protein